MSRHCRRLVLCVLFLGLQALPWSLRLLPTGATRISAVVSNDSSKIAALLHGEDCCAVQLPIYKQTWPARRRARKRDGATNANVPAGAIGLGDAFDVTYNVLIKVGDIETPVVLDTGSSDLWVLSSTCTSCLRLLNNLNNANSSSSIINATSDPSSDSGLSSLTSQIRLYPEESLVSAGLDVELQYGDSYTGTHASGAIGRDTVGVAGLHLDDQYFAAVNDTNTSVLDTGSAGIFGLGFPYNSVLWRDLYIETKLDPDTTGRRRYKREVNSSPTFDRQDRMSEHSTNRRTRTFPSLPDLVPLPDSGLDSRSSVSLVDVISSFSTFGPLISRLALFSNLQYETTSSSLSSPQFSITLERSTLDPGGNVGQLTLGSLPPSVLAGHSSDNLTWTNVRLYNVTEGGLQSAEAPGEAYPIAWEIYLDDVWLDGARLPRSVLGDPFSASIGLSALIDTGNSLIRGPADVISAIYSMISPSSSSSTPSPTSSSSTDPITYPCSEAHTLSFQFNGVLFNVDPRDFGSQAYEDNADECVPNIAATDPPVMGGFLYSWSLGIPFLKGVLASFYYGNLTYPSTDHPRIGFLSTVPPDASALLQAAISAAQQDGNNFLALVVPAPTGTLMPAWTDSLGVGQESETLSVDSPMSSSPLGTPEPDKTSSAVKVACSSANLSFRYATFALMGIVFVFVMMVL